MDGPSTDEKINLLGEDKMLKSKEEEKMPLHLKRPAQTAQALNGNNEKLSSLGLRSIPRHVLGNPFNNWKDNKMSGNPNKIVAKTVATIPNRNEIDQIPPFLQKEVLRTVARLLSPLGEFKVNNQNLKNLNIKKKILLKEKAKRNSANNSNQNNGIEKEYDVNKDPLLQNPKLTLLEKSALKKKLLAKHKKKQENTDKTALGSGSINETKTSPDEVTVINSNIKNIKDLLLIIDNNRKSVLQNTFIGLNAVTRKLENIIFILSNSSRQDLIPEIQDIINNKVAWIVFSVEGDLSPGLNPILKHIAPLVYSCNQIIDSYRNNHNIKLGKRYREDEQRKNEKNSIVLCNLGKGSTKRLLASSGLRKILAGIIKVDLSDFKENEIESYGDFKERSWNYSEIVQFLYTEVSNEFSQPKVKWLENNSLLPMVSNSTFSTMPKKKK